jgi:hypothetical protein
MKRKLLLTFALAGFLALTAVGIVQASSISLLDQGTSGVGINIPNGSPLKDLPKPQLPRCANGIDDDHDGLTDVADPDCDSGSSPPPSPTPTPTPGPNPGPGSGGTPPGGTGPGGRHNHHKGANHGGRSDRHKMVTPPARNTNGTPTNSNPTLSVASFGPAPIGVSNFMIDQFEIPPFLLPIYQACGSQYSIPWEILASINKIETNFGQLANVTSSAGAIGWMQFLPSTWEAYGVDANGDNLKDPGNPVDAICAAARYLRAAGGDSDLRRAIFGYNIANWYVDEVVTTARLYGKLPEDLVGSLTGLTEGAHFPVAADARYADDLSERQAKALANGKQGAPSLASSPSRRTINIFSRNGAPVVAVNDGVISKVGSSKALGNDIVLQDAYGNQYTYSDLASVAKAHPVPKQASPSSKDLTLVSPQADRKPKGPATAGVKLRTGPVAAAPLPSARELGGPVNTENLRRRLFALPQRQHNRHRASLSGQLDDLLNQRVPGYTNFKNYFTDAFQFDRKSMRMEPLRAGSQVVGGTVIGRIGKTDRTLAPHVKFAIRPAGKGAPTIDPKPVLDVWKLLEDTAIYRAAGKNPFTQNDVGQVLLLSKEVAIRRVLADPRLEIYSCGRDDIKTGQIDVRILRVLEYLTARGYRLTITALKCGHSILTTSGNVSEHSTGDAVDIAAVNGIPILGHQGKGSITEAVIKDVLQLQGTMLPHQVISLMTMGGPSFAMSDHADHIHIGYHPLYGNNAKLGQEFVRLLKPDQWQRLIGRIAEIKNPTVSTHPSKFAIPAGKGGGKRASNAHIGE